MFDISFAEIALILVIALLVLGPERLPRAAKMVGLWVRKAKASWFSVKAEFERELADEELKRSLQQANRDITEARKDFEAATREPAKAVEEVGRDTGQAATDLKRSIETASAAAGGDGDGDDSAPRKADRAPEALSKPQSQPARPGVQPSAPVDPAAGTGIESDEAGPGNAPGDKP